MAAAAEPAEPAADKGAHLPRPRASVQGRRKEAPKGRAPGVRSRSARRGAAATCCAAEPSAAASPPNTTAATLASSCAAALTSGLRRWGSAWLRGLDLAPGAAAAVAALPPAGARGEKPPSDSVKAGGFQMDDWSVGPMLVLMDASSMPLLLSRAKAGRISKGAPFGSGRTIVNMQKHLSAYCGCRTRLGPVQREASAAAARQE